MENSVLDQVPKYVIEAVEEVRQGGKYNMFEAQNVFYEIYQLGHVEAMLWLLNEKWQEGSYRSQVDVKKYSLALKAISEIQAMAHKLAK